MKCGYKACFIIVVSTLIVSLIPAGSSFAFYQEEEVEEEMTPEEYEAYNEQYNAYMAATEEQDPLKRGDMLLEFLAKYPHSKDFESYVVTAYEQLLFSCSDNGKYQELGTLAEKWLERNPNDLQTLAYAASAAMALKDDEKSLKYLLKIYEIEPTVDRALAVAQTYDKLGNFQKYVEWCETVFTYPEYSVDYTLRFNLVQRFLKKEDLVKASAYASKTLKALDAAEKPDAETQKKFRQIRRNCNHVIALNLFQEEKYKEAIKFFENALKNEKYQEGFYYIAECYWRLMDPETAHDYFAAAELMGGPLTQAAKEKKEKLYKPLHNQTLVGIEKVHKRAQAILDRYPDPVGTHS